MRQEIKFDISGIEKSKIIRKYKLRKIYEDREINSVYFDTIGLKFFNQSEEGITPRSKVRVRFYDSSTSINYEIKNSYNYIRSKVTSNKDRYEKKSFEEFLNKNNFWLKLYPQLLVSYNRSYYYSIFGRVTIDKNIKYAIASNYNFDDLRSKKLNFYNEPKSVLEVKIDNTVYVKDILKNFLEFRETRNSKYCDGINLIYEKKRNFVL